MSDGQCGGGTERIEKTATGPVSVYALNQIVYEMKLVATDSLPKLEVDTVRIEEIERLDDGMRRVTISGEKSEFCPTRDEPVGPGTEGSQ